jgi:myosin protein heavy chain
MHQLAAAQPVSTQYTKYSASRLSLGFTVSHYAAEVEYRTDGWLDKNRDPLNDTLTSLLANSTNPYTARLFAEYLEPDTIVDKPRIRKGAFRTVGQRHKEQLAFLMTQLSQTQPHFIRCIVPNLTKSPGIIDTPLVLNQLKCNGVLEGVRISRLGYPNRLPFLEFRRRFELLTPGMVPKGFVDGRTACEIMLRGLELEKESFKLGLSKVFFKAGILARLEERRDEYLSDIFTRIQATSRGFVARRLANKVLNRAAAVRTIQRNARLYIELKNWPWWPLFQRVRPLLAAARSDDEMRRKEAELIARREQAEKEVIERKRLELIQSDLESQRDKMIADLDNERLRSSEYEILWIQAKENQVASEEELSSIQTRLNSMNERVAQILVTKSLDDSRLINLTATLSISDKALATLRSEQIEWKKKEAALKESTSVKTVEWNSMVASKEKSRLRIKELESNLNDVEEDRKRESTRLSKSIEAAQTKLVATTSELSKLTTRLAMIETEARLSKDEVVALIKDKKEKEGIIKSKESEVNRVTRGESRKVV